MQLQIKDLKRGQRIYDGDYPGEYKVYSNPEFIDGKWHCNTTGIDEVETIFHEGAVIYDNPDLV